jgi:hypothetical protein
VGVITRRYARHSKGGGKEKENHRWLTRADLLKKLLERKVRNTALKRTIAKLEAEAKVHVFTPAGEQQEEVCKLVERHQEAMVKEMDNKLHKALLTDQMKYNALVKTGLQAGAMRFSAETIAFAMAIERRSPKAYDVVREGLRNYIPMPCKRTIDNRREWMPTHGGVHDETMMLQKEKAENVGLKPEDLEAGSVSFDAMYIRAGLMIRSKDSRIFGVVDLEEDAIRATFRKTGTAPEDQIANQYSVLYWTPLTAAHKFTFVVGSWATNGLCSDQVWRMVRDVIYDLHRWGFGTTCLVSDGAGENRTFNQTFCDLALCDILNDQQLQHVPEQLKDVKCAFRHPITLKPIVCMSDNPHLLKKFRNAAENSGVSYNRTFGSGTVFLNCFSRMRVCEAERAMSRRFMNDALHYRQIKADRGQLNFKVKAEIDGLVEYVHAVNSVYTFFTSSEPLRDVENLRLRQLGRTHRWFWMWLQCARKAGAEDNVSGHGDSAEKRFVPSRQCYYDLSLSVAGIYALVGMQEQKGRFVVASKIHQDYCEHHFQHLREMSGASSNMVLAMAQEGTRAAKIAGVHCDTAANGNTSTARAACRIAAPLEGAVLTVAQARKQLEKYTPDYGP